MEMDDFGMFLGHFAKQYKTYIFTIISMLFKQYNKTLMLYNSCIVFLTLKI